MVQDVLEDASELLEGRWGWRPRLEVIDQLRPHVWRVAVEPEHPEHPDASSVIVRLGPGRAAGKQREPEIGWPAVFSNEWAGAVFLNRLPSVADFVPDLVAYDLECQLLVCEDLGPGPSLVDVLLGDDAAIATEALVSHARLLGAIAAASRDRTDEYRRLRSQAGAGDPAYLLDAWNSAKLRSVLPRFEQDLGVVPRHGLEAELSALDEERRRPGAWLAYTPADACPDNNSIIAGTLRVFDFGFGGLHHLALDAAYSVIPFPTCWCYAPLPASVSSRMLTAFREEVVEGLPEVRDGEVWDRKVAWAVATWFTGLIATMASRELDREKQRGPLSGRQAAVAQLGSVAATTENHYPAIAQLANALETRLREHWRVNEIPTYPALAGGDQEAPEATPEAERSATSG